MMIRRAMMVVRSLQVVCEALLAPLKTQCHIWLATNYINKRVAELFVKSSARARTHSKLSRSKCVLTILSHNSHHYWLALVIRYQETEQCQTIGVKVSKSLCANATKACKAQPLRTPNARRTPTPQRNTT
jgi:hypothetical protein